MTKEVKKRARITPKLETVEPNHLSDYIYLMMANVEDGFIESGLERDVDYTAKDLMEFAKPLVIDRFKNKEKPMQITLAYYD